jgi:hypothetical protein
MAGDPGQQALRGGFRKRSRIGNRDDLTMTARSHPI